MQQAPAAISRLDWRAIDLGYSGYSAYLRGAHWQTLRDTYHEHPDTPKTCLCGSDEGLQLHHRTYQRLGAERLSDLRPLCAHCHTDVHVLARRNLLTTDLSDFASPERARRYQALREIARRPQQLTPVGRVRALLAARREALDHHKTIKQHQPNLVDGQLNRLDHHTQQARKQHKRFMIAARQAICHSTHDELDLVLRLMHNHRLGHITSANALQTIAALRRAQQARAPTVRTRQPPRERVQWATIARPQGVESHQSALLQATALLLARPTSADLPPPYGKDPMLAHTYTLREHRTRKLNRALRHASLHATGEEHLQLQALRNAVQAQALDTTSALNAIATLRRTQQHRTHTQPPMPPGSPKRPS